MLEAVVGEQIDSVSCDFFPENHEYKVTYNLRCKFFKMRERKEKCEEERREEIKITPPSCWTCLFSSASYPLLRKRKTNKEKRKTRLNQVKTSHEEMARKKKRKKRK